MSLQEQTMEILNNFENTPSETIVKTLAQIKNHFKSNLTRDYLEGKIQAISNASEESEKKKLCKNLQPYLDWYLQGI